MATIDDPDADRKGKEVINDNMQSLMTRNVKITGTFDCSECPL